MRNKISLSNFSPSSKDIFLFDTNILIHLFYPTMSTAYMVKYESLYADVLKQKSSLLLPAIQLSEFINRCIRFQFDLYKKINSESLDFKKDYRNTNDYHESMEGILNIVKQDILPHFTSIDDKFESMKPDSLLLYGFSYDFNDALLVQIAEQYNAAIVTHDSDFANYPTSKHIITDNRQLLMFS